MDAANIQMNRHMRSRIGLQYLDIPNTQFQSCFIFFRIASFWIEVFDPIILFVITQLYC